MKGEEKHEEELSLAIDDNVFCSGTGRTPPCHCINDGGPSEPKTMSNNGQASLPSNDHHHMLHRLPPSSNEHDNDKSLQICNRITGHSANHTSYNGK